MLKLVALGVLQGLTEFLPVSSSGHLGLGELLLGTSVQGDGATTEVALHAGTLLAVIVFVRRDVVSLLRCLLPRGEGSGRGPDQVRDARRLLGLLFLASLPAAVVGLAFGERIEALFDEPRVLGYGFLFTGAILLASRRFLDGTRRAEDLTAGAALLIGLAQMVAITPAVSRSGSTIVAALALSAMPIEAARFSFLMAIPVTGGAALLKARDILGAPPAELAALSAGVAAAFVVGLVALRFLTGTLRRGGFPAFAWYVIPLGFAVLVLTHRG